MSEEEKESEEQKSREIAVRRENPFSLFQEMDKLFDELSRNFFDFPRRRRSFDLGIPEEGPIFRTPLSNITETEDNFEISAELPGLDREDIEVTIHDGNLEIKGETKEEEKEEEEGEVVRREYRSSSYYRAFSLPENIEEDDIDAHLEKGVLKVSIPKAELPEKEKKKIEVK
ncbi:MAG: Hsp20/alpha crystallin family protein [Promethearchaeia archaeon]